MAAHISWLKASAFISLKKKYLLRNATTYIWDREHHLVGDRALDQKPIAILL
jgi:hypothetical protein